MVADPRSPPAQRPRPVADLPLEALLERAPEIVRSWALALIEALPLARIGEVPLQVLSEQGPALCEQLIRALREEAELDRLLDGSSGGRERSGSNPLQALAIAGGGEAGAVVAAVESLRGAVWASATDLLDCGSRSQAALLADLSDRLANVCAALSAAALAVAPTEAVGRSGALIDAAVIASATVAADLPAYGPIAADLSSYGPIAADLPAYGPIGRHAASAPIAESSLAPAGRGEPGIVIVDERGLARKDPGPGPDEQDEPSRRREIAIHDARDDEGPAAWIRSIGQQLERFERDGLPFAVVLLEVDGAGAQGEPDSLEQVLAEELHESGGGTLTRERAGRYWLLAHRADRIGAHALAVRLERALTSAGDSGEPVFAASGIAICPEDGTQPATLAAQADVGLYAARAEAGQAGFGRGGEQPD